MSFNKILLGFLTATLLMISCKKEHSNELGNGPIVVDANWEFKESGRLLAGKTDTAFIEEIGTIQTLNITGVQSPDLGTGEILLQVAGPQITTGTYATQYVFFQYLENGAVVYRSLPVQASDFSLVITQMDSASVTGTFSGTVEDVDGVSHRIEEGKFTAKIGNADPNPPVDSGQLTVWAKQICTDGGTIEVKVDGQTGQITDGNGAEPECGADGTATFTLLAGTYTVEAICGVDTVRYDVTIDGDCTTLEVDFQNPPVLDDYLPLTLGAFWKYNDLSSPATEQTITSTEEGVVLGQREFTKFVSTNGDEFYYRKEGSTYFQYITLDFQGSVANPPSLEIEILHDNLDAGQSWESSVEDVTVSGIPVKAKLVFTINKRDYLANINGVDYDNLIEVNTELFLSSDGGANFIPSGSAYNTVFSKGKGIVYYYDINRQIEWGVTEIFLGL